MIAAPPSQLFPPDMRIKRTVATRRWTSSIASFVAFGVLCAMIAYWTLQLLAPPVAIAPTGSLVDYRNAPDLASAAALFGRSATDAAPSALATVDVRVLGVAASPTRGSAVLAVESGGAKAYLVGDRVADDLRLVEVRPDAAVLERNGARIELLAPRRPSVSMLWSGPSSASGTGATAASGSVVDVAARAPTPPAPATQSYDRNAMSIAGAGSGRAAGAPPEATDDTGQDPPAQARSGAEPVGAADGDAQDAPNPGDRH